MYYQIHLKDEYLHGSSLNNIYSDVMFFTRQKVATLRLKDVVLPLSLLFFQNSAKSTMYHTVSGSVSERFLRLGLKAVTGPDSAKATEITELVRTEFTENYGKLRSSDTGIQRRYGQG